MGIEEKQFVKTFDSKKDDFVVLRSETDVEKYERIRYCSSQIDLLYSRIDKLTKSLRGGTFELSEEDVKERLNEIENKINVIESKVDLHYLIRAESKQNISNLMREINEKVLIDEAKREAERIAMLEKKYSFLSIPQIKNIFVSMIETIEVLSNRAKNVEVALATIREVAWSRKVQNVKKTMENKEKNLSKSGAQWENISASLKKLRFETKKKKESE